MAETTCLLNMRTQKWVPGVRIPLSPQILPIFKPELVSQKKVFSNDFFVTFAPAKWDDKTKKLIRNTPADYQIPKFWNGRRSEFLQEKKIRGVA